MLAMRSLFVLLMVTTNMAQPMSLVLRRATMPREHLIQSLLAMDGRLGHDDLVLSRIIDDLEHSHFALGGGDDIRMTKRLANRMLRENNKDDKEEEEVVTKNAARRTLMRRLFNVD